MAVSDYVELRCRSAFSFLDGASLPEDLLSVAAGQGHHTLALGDVNGLYGAPRFFGAATIPWSTSPSSLQIRITLRHPNSKVYESSSAKRPISDSGS